MLTATLFLSALLAPGGVPDPSGTTPGATPTDSFAIRATRVHMGGGEVVENGLVLVQDGRIAASGANVTVPDGVPVIEHEGDLSAGMIALHDHSAMRGENLDGTRAVLSEAELAFAVDVGHSDLARLAREGVTSIVVAPGSQALVGGITAVVKTTNASHWFSVYPIAVAMGDLGSTFVPAAPNQARSSSSRGTLSDCRSARRASASRSSSFARRSIANSSRIRSSASLASSGSVFSASMNFLRA